MISKKTKFLSLILLVTLFSVGTFLYPDMPDQMASHWNYNGRVDDFIPKLWGLFLLPLVTSVLLIVFLVIPKIDPLKKNIEKFEKYYEGFILLLMLFLSYVYLLTLAWNLGFMFDMNLMIIPAFAILFYSVGVLIEKSKRNWFIGIRTPWTLSDDRVWEKTHERGSKLFKIIGIISLVGLFFGNLAFLFILIPVLLITVYLVVFSYFEYTKLNKTNRKLKKSKKLS